MSSVPGSAVKHGYSITNRGEALQVPPARRGARRQKLFVQPQMADQIAGGERMIGHNGVHVFGILAENRLLARAAQNGVSMFARLCGAATARERSFRDVFPGIV